MTDDIDLIKLMLEKTEEMERNKMDLFERLFNRLLDGYVALNHRLTSLEEEIRRQRPAPEPSHD